MLRPVNPFYGCDPEGFFSKEGTILGSEKVLPAGGLKSGTAIKPHVVLDGVQFELNPPGRSSLALLGREISLAFTLLDRQLKKVGNNIALDWRGLVEVGQSELDALSDATRELGCNPSLNVYEEWEITVDPLTYRKRSAGGHLHLGLNMLRGPMAHRDELVPLLDILVGNTFVMLDRDPGAAERRENYGRAGEYRLPSHGLEYRVPSNFWLRNYSLMSLAFGLANIALTTLNQRFLGNDVEADLLELVKIQDIREAINSNNAELARVNFEHIRPFLAKHLPPSGFILNPNNLDRFRTFTDGVVKDGLAKFFPQTPEAHWVEGKQVEFDKFLSTIY